MLVVSCGVGGELWVVVVGGGCGVWWLWVVMVVGG